MGLDLVALDRYITGVLARRPREWNCGNFMEGWLKLHAPETAAVLEPNIPRPPDLMNARIQFIRDDIRDARSYRDKGLEWSEGRLTATDFPAPGDLAFMNQRGGFPTGGIVVPRGEAVFIGWRGELVRAPLDSEKMAYAGVSGDV